MRDIPDGFRQPLYLISKDDHDRAFRESDFFVVNCAWILLNRDDVRIRSESRELFERVGRMPPCKRVLCSERRFEKPRRLSAKPINGGGGISSEHNCISSDRIGGAHDRAGILRTAYIAEKNRATGPFYIFSLTLHICYTTVMLNIFPDLLTYSLLGPFILRVSLGILFINLGYLELTREKERWLRVFETIRFSPARFWVRVFGVVEIAGGLLLVLGVLTQAAALLFTVISLAEMYIEYRAPVVLRRNIVFYGLIFVISASLLLTGAGAFAFDLPL